MFLGLLLSLSLLLDREFALRGEGGRTNPHRSAVVAAPEPGEALADGGTPIPPKP